MVIAVVSATGSGHTSLSAFDNALKNAGVYNYNLVTLSSIIPTGARITKIKRYHSSPKETGWRLYVVKAELRNGNSDEYIGAGLGWYILKNKAGVFVEHELSGLTGSSVKQALRDKISASLSDLCAFRGEKFQRSHAGISMAVAAPSPDPQCALALAVYKAEPW